MCLLSFVNVGFAYSIGYRVESNSFPNIILLAIIVRYQ